MRRTVMGVLAVLGLSAGAAQGQYLMVPESQTDTIWLFDPQNGSLVTQQWADMSFLGLPGDVLPQQALQVGREIWVTDQAADTIAIFRVSKNTPELLTTISGATTGGLDNIRGISIHNNQLYVTSNNLGVWRYSLDGTGATQFINNTLSSWDIHFRANDILVTDSTGNDIRRYDFNGAYLGDFYNSPGSPDINFPQQITADGTDILVAGFSLTNTGIYRFDANGNKIGFLPINTGVRSTYRLGNGNILWTGGTRVGITMSTRTPAPTSSTNSAPASATSK